MAGFRKSILASLLLAAVSSVFSSSTSVAPDEAVTSLRWKSGLIRIAISTSLLHESSNIKRDSDVAGAIKRSIEAWSSVANIEFQQTNSDRQSASPSGAAGDAVSLITIAQTPENVLLFTKDPENAAATTRVFYNKRGAITEADIVLNPYQQFSTDGTLGTFDLQSTLTHEIGHLLGLPHSLVLGSTMHASYGKNGVFGLQNFSSRTLSATDIAAVRAIYGARGSDTECCGSIEGRLAIVTKQSRTFEIWIEDAKGRVQGSARTTDGSFSFAGLMPGKYRVFVQEIGHSKFAAPVRDLGEVTVVSGESASINAKTPSGAREFEINYLGFNGQLSEMAVSLSQGRSYVVYLGGRNLDPKKLSVSFTSPYLSVTPGTNRSLDYGDEISVISVEVRVSARAPKGEYSIFAESDRGEKRAIIGGLTIDNFTNPWNNFAGIED
jgi:hypothetical protein